MKSSENFIYYIIKRLIEASKGKADTVLICLLGAWLCPCVVSDLQQGCDGKILGIGPPLEGSPPKTPGGVGGWVSWGTFVVW